MKGSGPGEWSDIAKIGQSTKDLRGISQPCRGDGGPDSAAQGETHSPAFLFHFFSAQLLAPFAVSFSCVCVCVCVSARSDTEGEAHSKKRWSECHRKWLRQLSPTGNATRRSSISCSAVIPFPATSLNEWPSLVFRPPPRPFLICLKTKLSRMGIKEHHLKKGDTHTLTHKQKLELSVFHNTNLVQHNIIKTTAILCWLQLQPWSSFPKYPSF